MLDIFGALTSLLCTWYFIHLDNKAWLLSLIATCLNAWLYWQKGIYGDMVLEACYFLTTCYGLFLWRRKNPSGQTIGILSMQQGCLLVLTISCLFLIIRSLLCNYTNSSIPGLDALTTSLSLAAQCLMGYKIIFTWILWFFTDLIYACLYFHKNIPFHALLMLIYMGMAISGYRVWQQKISGNNTNPGFKLSKISR